MAIHVKLLSYVPATGGILWPAPSVRDIEHIRYVLDEDPTPTFTSPEDMIMRPLKVLTDYRGALMFVQGDVQVFRYAPRTEWYNGIAVFPGPGGVEDCRVYVGGVEYMAKIEFV